MGRVFWLVTGALLGVLLSQQASRVPAGRRVLAAVGGTTGEFVQAFADSYRAQRAEAGQRPPSGRGG